MKLFLMSLVLAGATHWTGTAFACPNHDEKVDVGQNKVVQIISTDGATSSECFVVGDEANAHNVFVVSAGANDGRSDKKRVFVRKIGDEKPGGWLGVSIREVPDALASQLDIEGKGVIIQNVVDGSPADKGGLEVHDIFMVVDGDDVNGDVTRAVSLVKANQPGDEIEVVVLRDGDERELLIKLGSRADLKGAKVDWKFGFAPDAEVEDRVQARGKMMWRSDDGTWEMKDLGDLHDLKNLPESIRMFVPKSGERSVQIFSEGGMHKVRTKVERDGNVLIIEQDGDEITVTRVEDGEESEATYESMDELREVDEEAYEMLEDSKGRVGVHINLEGLADINLEDIHELHDLHDLRIEIPDFEFEFDTGDWKEHLHDWHEQLEESLEAAKDAHGQAMDEFHALMKEWKDGDKADEIKKMIPQFIWKNGDGANFKALRSFGKPKHTFEVQTDGTIEVRIRKGDSEMVQLFEDETDLRRRSPNLFEKYEELMEIDEDE